MQKVEFIPQHLCYVIINDETGKQLVFWHLIKLAKYKNVWIHSLVNELGRLKHGIHDIKVTNKIKFIPKADVLEGQSVTYRHFVIDYCPQKQEPHRTKLTMDSNRIQYPWDVATPTASQQQNYCFNSSISTPKAKFFGADIKNSYLYMQSEHFEYMHLQLDLVLKEFTQK